MAKPTTIEEALLQNALAPLRMKIGNEETEQHPLEDQIKAADRAKALTAGNRNHFGVRFGTVVPGGTG